MTYQQMEILQEAACRYGNQFFDIAYQALLNGAHLINCEKPNNRTSIAYPDGITRFGPNGEIEYCCRAKFLPGYHAPYIGSAQKLTQEFNAAAVSLGIHECFEVYYEPYPYDSEHITVVAKPL